MKRAIVSAVVVVVACSPIAYIAWRKWESPRSLPVMQFFPSYVEYKGLYNVDAGVSEPTIGVWKHGSRSPIGSFPPLTSTEFEDVRTLMCQTLRTFGRPLDLTREETDILYHYVVGDEMVDRTLRVEMPRIECLTDTFVEAVQRDVLAKHTLWRVMIPGESEDTVVMIYPTVVRAGADINGVNWRSNLRTIISRIKTIREASEGPRRRQLEYLKKHIGAAVRSLGPDKFRLLAAFDNYRGDYQEITLWILYRQTGEWFDLTIREPESIAVSESFAVRSDGFFSDYYEPDDSELWLVQWVLPVGFRGPIVVDKWRAEGSEPWGIIHFDGSEIIKDSQLRGMRKGSAVE
jgi:hypothetical protein